MKEGKWVGEIAFPIEQHHNENTRQADLKKTFQRRSSFIVIFCEFDISPLYTVHCKQHTK